MQQERLTDTSTSQCSVSPHPQCVHRVCDRRGRIFFHADRLLVPPSIRDSGGDTPVLVNTLVGKSLSLECETNAIPPPSISWYKNGRLVTESANMRILEEGQRLEIQTTGVKIRS